MSPFPTHKFFRTKRSHNKSFARSLQYPYFLTKIDTFHRNISIISSFLGFVNMTAFFFRPSQKTKPYTLFNLSLGISKRLFVGSVKKRIVTEFVFFTNPIETHTSKKVDVSRVYLFLHYIFFKPNVHILQKKILHIGSGKKETPRDTVGIQLLLQMFRNIGNHFLYVRKTSAVNKTYFMLTVSTIGNKLQNQGLCANRKVIFRKALRINITSFSLYHKKVKNAIPSIFLLCHTIEKRPKEKDLRLYEKIKNCIIVQGRSGCDVHGAS